MQIQFIGAARTVTGSMHYIQVNGLKFLLDCGMIQGKRKDSFEANRKFDLFNPDEIDFLILSHAHIDHAGNLPNLIKHGFKGDIYCTHATKDLASILLKDSAHIQEKDVEFVNKRRRKQNKNLFEPLYTQQDVDETIKHFYGINYHREFEVSPEIKLTFFDAGHILGSAITLLDIKENGRIMRFGFSGDLGRPNLPIIKDPEKIPDVDFFICESTYGGRFHSDISGTQEKLAGIIKKAIDRKGKIIVPSFSVGRTQELLYTFHEMFEKGLAPRIPVYVDSPLSVNTTEIYRKHTECFDYETQQYLINNDDPFGFQKLTFITEVEESKELNSLDGPMMILSASGMAEAGRILHHLANNIENPNNIILMVGYCAENTLGRKLIEKEPEVTIFGEEKKVKAEVIVMNSLSAHADSNELIEYCDKLDKSRVQKFFIVHGDYDQQQKFSDRLKTTGFKDIYIPERGDVFQL